MDRKVKLALVGGSGVATTIVLREVVDPKVGVLIPQLGKLGTPSNLIGGLGGAAATILALAKLKFNKGPLDYKTANLLLAYGAPAAVSAALLTYFNVGNLVFNKTSAVTTSTATAKPLKARKSAPIAKTSQKKVNTVSDAVYFYPELMTAEGGVY